MRTKLTATATALVAATTLALVGMPTPDLQTVAVAHTDAPAYEAYKGAGYVCSALDMTTPERAASWLHESRGFTHADATKLVDLAQRHGCDA